MPARAAKTAPMPPLRRPMRSPNPRRRCRNRKGRNSLEARKPVEAARQAET